MMARSFLLEGTGWIPVVSHFSLICIIKRCFDKEEFDEVK